MRNSLIVNKISLEKRRGHMRKLPKLHSICCTSEFTLEKFDMHSHLQLMQFNNQGYIAQAMEDGVSNLRHKLELSIISQYLVLKVRFPIPDLRPLHDMDRAPWWKKNIRDDVLILELTEAHFNSNFDEMDPCWSFDIQCKDLHGMYSFYKLHVLHL